MKMGRKRVPAEFQKSLLAITEACIAWPDGPVSLRKLHRSDLLKRKRRELGLSPFVCVTSISNHLHELAIRCGVRTLFYTDEKRQDSHLCPGVKEKLQDLRLKLREFIRFIQQQDPIPQQTGDLSDLPTS
jgi:hypothetical protein